MFNFIRRVFVKFFCKGTTLVKNRESGEYFLYSHTNNEGMVVLYTQLNSYLPLPYKLYRRTFEKQSMVTISDIEYKVLGVDPVSMKLILDTRNVGLSEINEDFGLCDDLLL